MEHEILYRPSYSLLVLRMQSGEEVVAETGAMVSMSNSIEVKTDTRGGLLSGLKRSVLGGESFFINTFRANSSGEISFAPALAGDITHLELRGQEVFAQSGAYLASAKSVEVDTKWGGGKSFFAGEGLFLLRLTGIGDVWLSSYGAIHEKVLGPGETYVVDTGHIVSFDGSMRYDVRKIGGLKTTFFGGEGLVADFTGPGRLLMQTRGPASFLDWLVPKLPKQSGNN
ncbi:MAG: TIGR00266 family protein [Dehalococcoidia bacterium]